MNDEIKFFRSADSFQRYIRFRYGSSQAISIWNAPLRTKTDDMGYSITYRIWGEKWKNGPIEFKQSLADKLYKPQKA